MTTNAQKRIAQTRSALVFFLVGSFVGSLVPLTFYAIPADNKDLFTYILGQVSGMAMLALAFYFTKNAGQESADTAQQENTAKLTDAVQALAPAAADTKGEKP